MGDDKQMETFLQEVPNNVSPPLSSLLAWLVSIFRFVGYLKVFYFFYTGFTDKASTRFLSHPATSKWTEGTGMGLFVGDFLRTNDSYKDRLTFDMDGRQDGSSRFPKDRRWGFFLFCFCSMAPRWWSILKELAFLWSGLQKFYLSLLGQMQHEGDWHR